MKTSKITIVIIAIVVFMLMCTTISNATINPEDFIPTIGENDAGDAMNIAKKIVGVTRVVGIIVFVVITIFLGIKYMVGSIEEKAEYKKTMWPIFLGAILVFCIVIILTVINDMVTSSMSGI